MSLLLDTNICIAYLSGVDANVRKKVLAHEPGQIHLCSVVKAELLYGARHSGRIEANLRKLRTFCEPFESLAFDDEAAHWYGIIRSQLRREGRPMGSNDMLIAATALAADATLITRDQEDFSRIGGLRMEAW